MFEQALSARQRRRRVTIERFGTDGSAVLIADLAMEPSGTFASGGDVANENARGSWFQKGIVPQKRI